MNARSMSGINDSTSSGGGGDALLAGGTSASPQTFTGFNRFEELVNFRAVRPSLISTAATSNPTDDEFITKLDGEDLFGSLSGAAQLNGGGNTAEDPPQVFTGFNEFDENVVLGGQYLTFKNGTRRVIDMTPTPEPAGSNKILMTAPKNEITLVGTGSVNQLSMTAQNSAINTFLQTGTASTVNLISQVGANSTITTDGKFTTATAPVGVNDLCNKAYVDGIIKSGSVVGSKITYYNEMASYAVGDDYVNITQLEVAYTPTDTTNDIRITCNAHLGIRALGNGQTYYGIRLYRNGSHLTAASGDPAGATSINAPCWATSNYTGSQNDGALFQVGNTFLDTSPVFVSGVVTYSVATRGVTWNNTGGQYSSLFRVNRAYTNDNRFQRTASWIMVEEVIP